MLAASASLTVLLSAWGRALVHPAAPHGIVSFELAWTPEGLSQVFSGWSPETLELARLNTLVDFAYLIAYGAALSGACLLLEAPLARLFAAASMTAAFLDLIENVAGLILLAGQKSATLIAVMSSSALVKFTLVGCVLLYLLGAGAARASKIFSK